MTGYCKYCDRQANNVVKLFAHGKLIWTGCIDCFVKRGSKKEA